MSCKTGAEHIKSLQDGRTVYLDGKPVGDVTVHPAFRNSVKSAAMLYDFQARPENIELMTFQPNGANRRVNRAWQMPRNYAEMVQRRKAMQAIAGTCSHRSLLSMNCASRARSSSSAWATRKSASACTTPPCTS